MKNWLKAATVRALKTAAQTAVALIGTSQFISEINWVAILSAVALATLASYLTSIAGIPEVDGGESLRKIESASATPTTPTAEPGQGEAAASAVKLGSSPADAPTLEEGK